MSRNGSISKRSSSTKAHDSPVFLPGPPGSSPSPAGRVRFGSNDASHSSPEIRQIRKSLRSANNLQTQGTANSIGGNIQVTVRVRPFNKLEKEQKSGRCVDISKNMVTVTNPEVPDDTRSFNLDLCFNSIDEAEADYASQERLMEMLGSPLIDAAMEGYNNCIFAYGQTGSGKTFSVLGSNQQPGLLPRIAEEVFLRLDSANAESQNNSDGKEKASVRLSYVEIYNEQLRDLLATPEEKAKTKLEVHAHPTVGVWVKGLKEVPVFNQDDIMQWLDYGMKARSVGATVMNAESSRSHCIFTMEIQRRRENTLYRSKTNLVDLAGSERANKTKAKDQRLKEGSAINQSLSALANVINKLAEKSARASVVARTSVVGSSSPSLGKKRSTKTLQPDDHIPFRNSKLTHLLTDSLSGNSKTVMLAALSPAAFNFEETLSTLRFAESVKKVKTKAEKNTEAQGTLVEQLQAECEKLRRIIEEKEREASLSRAMSMEARQSTHSLGDGQGIGSGLNSFCGTDDGEEDDHEEMEEAIQEMELEVQRQREELEARQALIEKYSQDIAEQRALAARLVSERAAALDGYGLNLGNLAGTLSMDAEVPQMVNMNYDPALCGCLTYFLQRGEPIEVGSDKGRCKVVLDGVGVEAVTSVIQNKDNREISIRPMSGRVLLNGKLLREPAKLHHNDRLIFGFAFFFRVSIPKAAGSSVGEEQAELQKAFEVAMAEIGHESSESCGPLLDYVRSLGDRVGSTKALVFFRKFRKLLPLVDEANATTNTLRPRARLEFGIEALTDMQLSCDEPDCIVRLKQLHSGATRWKHIVRSKVLKSSIFERVTNELTDKRLAVTVSGSEPSRTILLLTAEDFRERLNLMRELMDFHTWPREKDQGSFHVDEVPLSRDPWSKVPPSEAARIAAELEAQKRMWQSSFSKAATEEAVASASLELDRMQQELRDCRALTRQLESRLRIKHGEVQYPLKPYGLPGHIQAQLAKIDVLHKSSCRAYKDLISPDSEPARQVRSLGPWCPSEGPSIGSLSPVSRQSLSSCQ